MIIRYTRRIISLRSTRLLSYRCGLIPTPKSTLSDTLACTFEIYADRPLLCSYDKNRNCLGEWLTYEEFSCTAQRIGSFLADSHGLKTGDRVGICHPNSTAWFLIEHACALRGFVSVSLPISNHTVLGKYTEDFDIKILFVDTGVSLKGSDDNSGASVAAFADACNWNDSMEVRAEELPQLSDDLLYTIILTSGSTGKPKGVKFTRRMWNQDLVAYPAPQLRTLSYLPMSHIVDRHHASITMFNGGEIVVMDSVESAIHALDVVSPTVMFTTPALCSELLRASSLGKELHTLICVAGTIQPDIADQLKEKKRINIVNPYGLTDVGNIAVDGVLLDHIEYKVKPWRRPSTASPLVEYGELRVRSHFEGYENSARVAVDEDGFFCTGDIVEIDNDRRIKIVGRTGERVKLPSGEWLIPSALEAVIEGDIECLPVLSDVYVTVVPQSGNVIAMVHVRSGYDEMDKSAVLKLINRPLLRHGFIRVVDLLFSAVPFTQGNNLRNHSLKLNRAALQEMFAKELNLLDDPEIGYVYNNSLEGLNPVDVTVRYLTDSTEDLPPDVSFRHLGGDSLKALEVKYKLLKHHNITNNRLVALLLHSTYTLSEVKAILRGGQPPREYESKTFSGDIKARLSLRNGLVKHSSETVILITGANGFIGKNIVNELRRIELLNTGTRIKMVCLMRRPSQYSNSDCAGGVSGSFEGSTVLYGDISVRNLGLSDSDYESLTQSVTHIIHAAGNTNQALPCSDLSANVTGLSEVLLLAACSSNLEVVTVLSSTDILPNGTQEVFPLSVAGRTTLSGYAEMKLQEEKVIYDAVCSGMSGIVICRVGLVCNVLESPDCERKKDFIDIVFDGIADASATPILNGDSLIPKLVPVDVVSNWIVALSLATQKGGDDKKKVQVFHLINGDEDPLTYKEIFHDMPHLAVPYDSWVSILPESSALRRLVHLSDIFQQHSTIFNQRHIVNDATTRELARISTEGAYVADAPRVRDIIKRISLSYLCA